MNNRELLVHFRLENALGKHIAIEGNHWCPQLKVPKRIDSYQRVHMFMCESQEKGELAVGPSSWEPCTLGILHGQAQDCVWHTPSPSQLGCFQGRAEALGHQAAGSGPLDRKRRPEKAQVSAAALRLYVAEKSSFSSFREISVADHPERALGVDALDG